MIPDLNIFAQVSRSLELVNRTYVVNLAVSARFMASLQPPVFAKKNDGSPRDSQPYVLRWRYGLLGPLVSPKAGWRVTLARVTSSRSYENTVYELLSDPREIRNGANSVGVQAEILPVVDLYPYAASLQEQDGTIVGGILTALWSEREDHASTGTYEDFAGEVDIANAELIKSNRRLVIGGETYRIMSSITDLEGPRVKFTARRANG